MFSTTHLWFPKGMEPRTEQPQRNLSEAQKAGEEGVQALKWSLSNSIFACEKFDGCENSCLMVGLPRQFLGPNGRQQPSADRNDSIQGDDPGEARNTQNLAKDLITVCAIRGTEAFNSSITALS